MKRDNSFLGIKVILNFLVPFQSYITYITGKLFIWYNREKGNSIQRLPHLWIHPICRQQTQTILLMQRSAWWQKPGIAVPWELLPEPDQYKCGCKQPTIGLSIATPVEKLGEGLTEGADNYLNFFCFYC